MEEDYNLFGDLSPSEKASLEDRKIQFENLRQQALQEASQQLNDGSNNPIPTSASIEARRRRYILNESLRSQVFQFKNVFTISQCETILKFITEYSKAHGWDSARHDSFPTNDIPVERIPELNSMIHELLNASLMPLICKELMFERGDLEFVDLFVVSYDAQGGKRSLDLHTDGCLISFNILLNPLSEFEEGGTYFSHLDASFRGEQGGAVVHSSKLLHAGKAITNGRRFILVGFVDSVGMNATVKREKRYGDGII